MFTFKINGETLNADVEPNTPMLWIVRDEFNLTGTKYGCGVAACGACTVLVDGEPTRSCQLVADSVGDFSITTIEGMKGPVADAILSAWRELDVAQCGYCQSGMILLAFSLLTKNKQPTEEEILDKMNLNVCRCATYVRILAAVKLASKKLSA